MIQWLQHLDVVLRTYKTDTYLLLKDNRRAHPWRLLVTSLALGAVYGVCMGAYAVFTRKPPCYAQMFLSGIKVPALFILTLIVTLPSLYVFGALQGIKLSGREILRLIMIPITVNLAVLASLGPITGFFTLCTTSYPFIKLMNVAFFGLSGILGLKALMSMIERLDEASPEAAAPTPEPETASRHTEGDEAPAPFLPKFPARPSPRSQTDRVFKAWLVIYALVGAQMGWVLRPFIGAPDMPFEVFRARDANFFIDVFRTLGELIGF